MIRSLGHEYFVTINARIRIRVTGHNYDEAEDKAIREVEEMLKGCERVDSEVDVTERGEEALDIMEDDE